MIVYGHDITEEERDIWLSWLIDHNIPPHLVPLEFEVEVDERTGEVIVECYKNRRGVIWIEDERCEVTTVKVRRIQKKEIPRMKGINKLRSIIK